MRSLKRRYAVVLIAMAIVAPVALALHYNVPAAVPLRELRERIPNHFGLWHKVAEHGPQKEEIEILETDAILSRTYARAGSPSANVELSVVYAANNRRVAHPPELCYQGSGWEVMDSHVVHFPVQDKPFRANRLLLRRARKRRIVLYWYKAGAKYYANYVKMQWGIIKTQLQLRKSSSALLRVSAESPSPERDDHVAATLEAFATRAIPALTPALP